MPLIPTAKQSFALLLLNVMSLNRSDYQYLLSVLQLSKAFLCYPEVYGQTSHYQIFFKRSLVSEYWTALIRVPLVSNLMCSYFWTLLLWISSINKLSEIIWRPCWSVLDPCTNLEQYIIRIRLRECINQYLDRCTYAFIMLMRSFNYLGSKTSGPYYESMYLKFLYLIYDKFL